MDSNEMNTLLIQISPKKDINALSTTIHQFHDVFDNFGSFVCG